MEALESHLIYAHVHTRERTIFDLCQLWTHDTVPNAISIQTTNSQTKNAYNEKFWEAWLNPTDI